jgi:hypothetical protein
MKFTEFYNRQKNVIASGSIRKIDANIEISEERKQFFDAGFKKGELVQSQGVVYKVLEKGSNFYNVVDESGQVLRMFPKALSLLEGNYEFNERFFRGYEPSAVVLEKHKELLENIKTCEDDIAVLNAIKGLDSLEEGKMSIEETRNRVEKTGFSLEVVSEEYKPKDKMTVAMIIADACGLSHDGVTNAESLVNQAIRKAAKNPTMLKNKELVQNMLKIATDVGIKYNPSIFDKLGEGVEQVSEALDADDYDEEEKTMGYAELKKHLSRVSGVKDMEPDPIKHDADGKNADETSQDVPAKAHELPHGHTSNPTSDTHRKPLIKKYRGA